MPPAPPGAQPMLKSTWAGALLYLTALFPGGAASADSAEPGGRAAENAIAAAEDAFGSSVGNETIGLYSTTSVRGFSPIDAGNLRIEGLYFDQRGGLVGRVRDRSSVRVGLAAQSYPLPAPTGIVDYSLRSATERPSLSLLVGITEYGGSQIEIDTATPISPSLSLNAGVALAHREYVSGSNIWFLDTGLIGRWQPKEHTGVTVFFSRYDYWDQEASPVVFTGNGVPPPRLPRRRYFGQEWAQWAGRSQNVGALGQLRQGSWRVEAGLFFSEFTRDEFAAQIFTDVDSTGVGERTVFSGVDQYSKSVSGEVRVAREWRKGSQAHRVFASARGRDVAAEFGGYDVRSLGLGSIHDRGSIAEPDRAYGPRDRDEQQQIAGALGWTMVWPERFEVSVGLQRATYEKTALPAEGVLLDSDDNIWLWNASTAIRAGERLVLYAGVSRGLEDSGNAPNNATNRGQPLPALVTSQSEAGIRYRLAGNLSLLAGIFEIEKPYFELDPADSVFRTLGQVVHRGTELSLTGQPLQGLTVVAGMVLLDPQVRGATVTAGLVGARPLGRPDITAVLNVDYRLPGLAALSLDLGVNHTGRQAADSRDALTLPPRTTFDLGMRYRFTLAERRLQVRFQVRNVSGEYGLQVSGGGGFTPVDSRRFVASLAADL